MGLDIFRRPCKSHQGACRTDGPHGNGGTVYTLPQRSKDIWPTYARFNEEQNEELVYLQSDIQNLVNQKMAAWCVNGGIEDEWDDYINSLKMMGLEEMRAIYQEVYDCLLGRTAIIRFSVGRQA